MTNPEVMTVKELAQFLRLPVSSVYRLVRDGTIPGVKLGRHWRFYRKAVEQWLGYSTAERHAKNLGIHYKSQQCFDISEQPKLLGKFDVRVNQLARGKFNGALEEVQTPQVTVYKQYWGRKAEAFGVMPQGYIFLGTSADAQGSKLQWCGTPLAHQLFAVGKPGDNVDYVISNRCTLAGLMIKPEILVSAVGQKAYDLLISHRTAHFTSAASRQLIATVSGMIHSFAKDPELKGDFIEVRSAAMVSRLFDALANCLESSGRQEPIRSASRRRFYVRNAIARLEFADRPLTAMELAGMVGVSQRTLNYAFREVLDMVPCTYLQLHRLNAAHKDLKQADPKASTVTGIALKWGFGHAGRFSGLHKKFFNERPSEVLHRA
jgi:excisionase family DNA binding protein